MTRCSNPGGTSPPRSLHRHRLSDDAPDLLRRLDKMVVGKVSIARRGAVSAVPKQFAH